MVWEEKTSRTFILWRGEGGKMRIRRFSPDLKTKIPDSQRGLYGGYLLATLAAIPMQGVHTIYATIGDLFDWLSIAGLVVLVGVALAGRPEVGKTVEAAPCGESLPVSWCIVTRPVRPPHRGSGGQHESCPYTPLSAGTSNGPSAAPCVPRSGHPRARCVSSRAPLLRAVLPPTKVGEEIHPLPDA
jgi:hypothetical protein